jgi:hypothetical protein
MSTTSTPDISTKHRRPAWMRVLDILFRTGHIAVAGILFGGFVLDISFFQLLPWHNLTIATGCVLLVLELCQSLKWPHQGRGVLGIIHIAPLAVIHQRPDLAVPLLWVVIVSGCIGSHMPRNFRHWSFIHRKVID